MKAVVQRVQNATVTVDGLVISAIGPGLLAWIGFGNQDNNDDIQYMVHTLLTTRFFHSERGTQRWTRSLMDCGYELLILTQISLYSTVYMEKPYFYEAMNARRSKPYYENMIRTLRRRYRPDKVREGRFGAGYVVTSQSKGPVFTLESFKPNQVPYPPVGPPPPYPEQHPPPQYYAPPPPPAMGQPRSYHRAYQPAPVHPYPPNSTYNNLPPLKPMQPYPEYPNYPVY